MQEFRVLSESWVLYGLTEAIYSMHIVVMDYTEGTPVSILAWLKYEGYDLMNAQNSLITSATQVLTKGFSTLTRVPAHIIRGGQIVLLI